MSRGVFLHENIHLLFVSGYVFQQVAFQSWGAAAHRMRRHPIARHAASPIAVMGPRVRRDLGSELRSATYWIDERRVSDH